MYDDAVQAFDAVLERYPDNPKTPDALYGKADALVHAGHRTEAAAEFKDFLARFPTHSLARNAQAQLRDLGTAAAPSQVRRHAAARNLNSSRHFTGRNRSGNASVCYIGARPCLVGLWRSWERASMAWKRSTVRTRPGPPILT